jgi:hypothetical protein
MYIFHLSGEKEEKLIAEVLTDEACQIGFFRINNNYNNTNDVTQHSKRQLVASVGKMSTSSNVETSFCGEDNLSTDQVRISSNKFRLSTYFSRFNNKTKNDGLLFQKLICIS